MAPIMIDARDAQAAQLRGWGRYTRHLVAALAAGTAGELDVVAVRRGGPGPEIVFEQLGLPVLLRRRRAALVHAPNCFLPLIRPCPGVVTIHDLAFEAWPEDFAPRTRVKFQVITRLAARSAQRIICPSQATAEDLAARYGIDRAKVRVIPGAASLAHVGAGPGAPDFPGAGDPYVIAVGDLRRKKNLAALVSAFVAARRADGLPHRLVLAGVDSGEGERLRALAADAPVLLTGYVDDARLDTLIAGADLLVHPSLYEGFGLVLLEAMARSTPVLAARATALPETAGAAAAYFEPDDPADLARQLQRLLGDPARRSELAVAGLARAAQFSWERTARATADVYRELL
ncbi:MAG: glycosyltransferase family 4 protein [Solirubrobacteraceae bacterium]